MATELDKCWPIAREELEDIIDNLEGGGGGGSGPISILDTNSVDLGGDGQVATPLTANVKISPNAGNQVSILSNGLFVPAPSGGGGAGTITANDTSSIDMTGNGSSGTPLTADVKISPDADNATVILSNGVYTTLHETDTITNLLIKQTGGDLVTGRWYKLAETKTVALITGVEILVMAAASNSFSNQALMMHPSFPQHAWPSVYDIMTDTLVEVRDHRGNIVYGQAAILAFPFQYIAYTNLTVKGGTANVYTWSALCTIDNTVFDDPASIDLTGYAGSIIDCYFGPDSTVTLSGGEGGGDGGDGDGDPPAEPGLHLDGVLLKDTNNNRFIIRGANLEMYRDYFGGCGWASDGFYDEMVIMTDKLVALGVNFVRLNYTGTTLAGGGRLAKFLDVAEELASRGIYVMPSDHEFTGDPLTGASSSYAMMGSIIDGFVARDILDYLVMNPWNEPGPGITNANWRTAQEGVLNYLRTTKNFHGVVVLDGSGWATMLDVTTFNQVRTYDATVNSGVQNVMFSHHLYPNITYSGLPTNIWGAADEVPLLIGELGQENPGASPLEPSYVTAVIDGFFATGRPAGHNGLISWIMNWCDSNKMWEDWTNPSVPYYSGTPLNTYGELWRDEYFSILVAEGGSSPTPGEPGEPGESSGDLKLVTVIDAILTATDFDGSLSNSMIVDGSTLAIDSTTGVLDNITVRNDGALDLTDTTVDVNYIEIVNGSEADLTGKTAGTLNHIYLDAASDLNAPDMQGNFTKIDLFATVLNADGATATLGPLTARNAQVNLNNLTGSLYESSIIDSQLTGTDAVSVNFLHNEISGGSVVDFSSADNLNCQRNHIHGSATVDLSGGDGLTFNDNLINHASVNAAYGTITDCTATSGGGITGCVGTSTNTVTNCTVESGGTISVEFALNGDVDNCKVSSGAALNCNADTFTGTVHDCELSTGGILTIGNAPHAGDVYYLSVRAGRYVEAAASTGFTHRNGIHAGSGTYSYTPGANALDIRDQD